MFQDIEEVILYVWSSLMFLRISEKCAEKCVRCARREGKCREHKHYDRSYYVGSDGLGRDMDDLYFEIYDELKFKSAIYKDRLEDVLKTPSARLIKRDHVLDAIMHTHSLFTWHHLWEQTPRLARYIGMHYDHHVKVYGSILSFVNTFNCPSRMLDTFNSRRYMFMQNW